MTVQELIVELLDHPMDSFVYVGKGIGVVVTVTDAVTTEDERFVILSPVQPEPVRIKP